MKKEEKKLNKIIFFRFAFIGAALLIVAAFWSVLNEVEPGGITARLACDEKGMLNGVLVRLKEQIPSISGIKVAEYLFSK